jgi:hypothetical protein
MFLFTGKHGSSNKRVIAIDPGRSNLIYGVEKKNDSSDI